MSKIDLSGPIPWPSPDDDLFGVHGGPWRTVANVRGSWGRHASIYGTGYRQAAELLAQHVIKTGFDQDFLVYPTMFLYRQFLELRLKEIALDGARLLDAAPPKAMMERHDLAPLWTYCRQLLKQIDDGPWSDLDHAERTLDQIDWADQGSYSFRYAKDKDGERSLPKDLTQVDIARVYDVMSGVANLVDGVVEFIYAQQETKDEMERDYDPC